jgi:hypothetical protein
MKYLISESQYDKLKTIAFQYLDKISKHWTVDYFNFDEIRITNGDEFVFDYTTNETFSENEKHNILHVNSNLVEIISGLFPIIDEYDIMEWFNKEYNRDADMVNVDYEDD